MDKIDLSKVPKDCKRIVIKRGSKRQVINCMPTTDSFSSKIQEYFDTNELAWQDTFSIIKHDCNLSLRVLDWLLTNLSHKLRLVFEHHGRPFWLHAEYKSALSAYTKARYDVFARTSKIMFTRSNGDRIITSVAQLNFFRWASLNGVIKFAKDNVGLIEADMLETAKKRATLRKPGKRVRDRTPPPVLQKFTLSKPIVLVGGHPA